MLDRRQFIASLPLISGAARALAVGLPVEELTRPRAFGGAVESDQPQGVRVRFGALHITLHCRVADYRRDAQPLYDAGSNVVSYIINPTASLSLTDVTMWQADVDDLIAQLRAGPPTTGVTIDMLDTAKPGGSQPLLAWPDVRVYVDDVRPAGGLDVPVANPTGRYLNPARYAEIRLLLRHPPMPPIMVPPADDPSSLLTQLCTRKA
jgi:hypothetical protein